MSRARSDRFLRLRLDLGLRALAPEWRALFSRSGWKEDLESGVLLAAQTLPLSILLANFAGASAWTGIVSAALGSTIAVALGGTRSALSGPGLASALVASSIAARHGLEGLAVAALAAGALQLLTGALGLGRFVRLVPIAVLRGALIGIGAAILLAQLPYAIGASVQADASELERLDALGAFVPKASPIVLVIAGISALLGLGSLLHRRIPGSLLALALSGLAVFHLGLEVPTLASAEALALPALPTLPSTHFAQLAGSAFALWMANTLGAALSVAVLERLDRHRADPDQELIGQGAATVALAFFGGLPATQLVARSAIAVRLGVTRRRPALVQALVVLALGLAVLPVLRFVPVAALTGVAIAVAIPLLDPRPLLELARISRFDLGLAFLTALGIALAGLVEGAQAGMAIALVAATLRLTRTRATVHAARALGTAHHVSFSGPLTFLAALELERLRERLACLAPEHGVLIDLRGVISIDATGADRLLSAIDEVWARGGKVALLGPSPLFRQRLIAAAVSKDRKATGSALPGDEILAAIAPTERDVDAILGHEHSFLARPHLLAGLERFREEMRPHYDSVFAHLADGQHPHTLFLTCVDSRVSPGLLMGAHPGDLFIVRCIGALVPPRTSEAMPQEGAAIEYAVGVLGVRQIVVCGHSKCGAIGALRQGEVPDELPTLARWASGAGPIAGDVHAHEDADEATRAITVRQLDNLMSYELVRERVERGELQLHAWFYDLGAIELFEWDAERGRYAVLGVEEAEEEEAAPESAKAEEAEAAPRKKRRRGDPPLRIPDDTDHPAAED